MLKAKEALKRAADVSSSNKKFRTKASSKKPGRPGEKDNVRKEGGTVRQKDGKSLYTDRLVGFRILGQSN